MTLLAASGQRYASIEMRPGPSSQPTPHTRLRPLALAGALKR